MGKPAEPTRTSTTSPGSPVRTLLLIEWDGADPVRVASMLSEGELPNLARLAAEGVYMELTGARSVWTDVPWADPGMAGDRSVSSSGAFFAAVREDDPRVKRVAMDDADRGARDWDLDLLVDTGGWSNDGITEKAVACVTDLAEESTTVFIRYRASEHEQLLEADAALRTLRTALRILGSSDRARLYVAGGSGGVTRFLATNDGDLASATARARESAGAPSSVREQPPEVTPAARTLPNILLIVVDTLRADRLSVYGYSKPTTPNIDGLADRGVLFESASAPSCWTLPGFASILTGKHPRTLGLFDDSRRTSSFAYVDPPLNRWETVLPEVLRRAGYRTAGFFTGHYNEEAYGFGRGFDLYRSYRMHSDPVRHAKSSFPQFLPDVFAWIESSDARPFFVLLNPADPHRPYLPPLAYRKPHVRRYTGFFSEIGMSRDLLLGIDRDRGGWRLSLSEPPPKRGGWPDESFELPPGQTDCRLDQEDIDYLRNRYDAGVTFTDDYVGLILDRLAEIRSNTVVVLISDHGEALGDHGVFLHNTNPPRLYEEISHVPWIMSAPPQWLEPVRRVVREPVMLVDLMPTLLELVGIPIDGSTQGMQGRSLLGVVRGEEPEDSNRLILAEAVGHGHLVSTIRRGDWKLISTRWRDRSPVLELYNLRSDRSETRDLARRERSRADAMLADLDSWIGRNGGRRGAATDRSRLR